VRADADAGIGDDEIGRTEAIDEVLRGRLRGLGVSDVERIAGDGAGEGKRDRAAGDQAERRAGRRVVPRQRFADAG